VAGRAGLAAAFAKPLLPGLPKEAYGIHLSNEEPAPIRRPAPILTAPDLIFLGFWRQSLTKCIAFERILIGNSSRPFLPKTCA
jgi:hypothetical protein